MPISNHIEDYLAAFNKIHNLTINKNKNILPSEIADNIPLNVSWLKKYPYHGMILDVCTNYYLYVYQDRIFEAKLGKKHKRSAIPKVFGVLDFEIPSYAKLANCDNIEKIAKKFITNDKEKVIESLEKEICITKRAIEYRYTLYELIIEADVVLSPQLAKNHYEKFKEYKDDIISILIKKIENDSRFKKYKVPLNFFKVKQITLNDGVAHVMIDMKMTME